MKGPGYTVNDLVFYTGLFAGIIGAYLVLKPAGVHPLLCFLIGAVGGAGLGWVMERVYRSATAPPPRNDRDDFPPNDRDRPTW